MLLIVVILSLNMRVLVLFLITLFISFSIFKSYRRTKDNQIKRKSSSSIWKQYEEMCKDKLVVNDDIFHVYKGPSTLKYLKRVDGIREICEELNFLTFYEVDMLLDVLIYLDFFFKIHYKTMLGKYDSCTYIPILIDIQKLIINNLAMFVFNIPITSKIVDKNLDKFMNTKIQQIQSITSRYINIITKKYNCVELSINKSDTHSKTHEYI